eukprot:3813739-Rhodomonas_salina.3
MERCGHELCLPCCSQTEKAERALPAWLSCMPVGMSSGPDKLHMVLWSGPEMLPSSALRPESMVARMLAFSVSNFPLISLGPRTARSARARRCPTRHRTRSRADRCAASVRAMAEEGRSGEG